MRSQTISKIADAHTALERICAKLADRSGPNSTAMR
jgi:hypothetical protein